MQISELYAADSREAALSLFFADFSTILVAIPLFPEDTKKMTESRISGIAAPLIVLIVSLGLLVPGITQPLITLQADMSQQVLVREGQKIMEQQSIHPALLAMANQFLSNLKMEGQSRIYDKTRSILGTASDLWNFGYKFVAILILTFSVLIPAIKSLLLLASCHPSSRRVALKVNAALGKWSMADVFAMGVIVAMLAANANTSESALLSFQAELHCGFYLFVAYCLVSGLAGQLLLKNGCLKDGCLKEESLKEQ